MRFLALAGAVALAAATADVTPDSARHLATAVHDWVSHILGPAAPDLPIQAEAQGDHYRVTAPLMGVRTSGAPPELSADVREQPDGTWRIDRASLPARFAVPVAGGETHISIGHQAASGIVDPSLHAASTLHAEAADIRTTGTPAGQRAEQRIGRGMVDISLTPTRNGKLDLVQRSQMENWQSGAITGDGMAVGTGFRTGRAELALKAVAPDRVAPAVHALLDLIVAAPPGGQPPEISSQFRSALRALIEALDGLAGSARLDESFQGLQIELAGVGHAAMDRARFGLGEESTEGLLRAWVDIAVDGLAISGVPEGLSAIVPTRISLRPSVKGVPAAALKNFLLARMGDGDSASHSAPADRLFAKGSLAVGVDGFSFAIGPAQFSGAGVISFPSATTREGEARVMATGFEELLQEATGNPSLNRVAPVLVVARGLAKQEGDHLVWVIHAGPGGDITVNGMDLSSLLYRQPAQR